MSSEKPGPSRGKAATFVVLAVLGAIPFWAAVGYLDPLAALRPAAPRPVVEIRPRLRMVPSIRCRELQNLQRQSLEDCTPPIRHRPTPIVPGPGDYPPHPDPMAGDPSTPSGS